MGRAAVGLDCQDDVYQSRGENGRLKSLYAEELIPI